MNKRQREKLERGLTRLEALAQFLRELPRKKFNYDQWVGDDYQGKPDISCGTTACAFGWATVIEPRLFFENNPIQLDGVKHDDWSVSLKVRRDGKTVILEGLDAAAYFYGISFREASSLFMPEYLCHWEGMRPFKSPNGGAMPKTVARHIEKFVEYKRKTLTNS